MPDGARAGSKPQTRGKRGKYTYSDDDEDYFGEHGDTDSNGGYMSQHAAEANQAVVINEPAVDLRCTITAVPGDGGELAQISSHTKVIKGDAALSAKVRSPVVLPTRLCRILSC